MLIRMFIPVVIVVLLSFLSLAQDYEEGIYLIRPDSSYIVDNSPLEEFLSVEDLFFMTCIEREGIQPRSSVICLDNNNFQDLENTRWTKDNNCYMSYFSLDNFDCSNVRIQSHYIDGEENQQIYKDIRVNKFSKILDNIVDSQYSDGGWDTTRDTAYGVWSLSHFSEIFDYEMDMAIEWLEDKRNENRKCWPESRCDIPLTLEVLYVLSLSGYDDARRVVFDARNYLESRQNFFKEGDTFTLDLTAFVPDTTIVMVAKNRDVIDSNVTISNGTYTHYKINISMNDTIYALGYENFQATVKNQFGEIIYEYQGNNLSYTIEGACWSSTMKGEPCNAKATAFGSLLDFHEKNVQRAREWMATQVDFPYYVGAYWYEENTTIYSSLFLKSFAKEDDYDIYSSYFDRRSSLNSKERYDYYMEELTKWLLYNQNNEGSWGPLKSNVSRKAVPTSFAVNAIMEMGYNRTFEPVEDAEKWMSTHEELLDKNDTISQSAAFYLLRNNARPLVKSKEGVLLVNKESSILELSNPTVFSLEDVAYEVSSELEPYIEVAEKEQISAYSYRRIKIYREERPDKNVYGYITVSNLEDPIARIPVVVTDMPYMNISYPGNLVVFGKSASLPIDIQGTKHKFDCSMVWDYEEIDSPDSFTISKSRYDLPIEFDDAKTREEMYKGTLSCEAQDYRYDFEVSVYVTRYSSVPLTVKPEQVFVNDTSQDIVLTLKNNLDRDLTPEIELRGNKDYFQIPPTITLNPLSQRNITLKSNMPEGLNQSSTLSVIIEALGKRTDVSVYIDILEEKGKTGPLAKIIFLSLLIIFLAGASYITYYYRKKLVEIFKKYFMGDAKREAEMSLQRLDSLREEEMVETIKNFVDLLKFQSKTDYEMEEILKKNFTIEELAHASRKAGLNLTWAEDKVGK